MYLQQSTSRRVFAHEPPQPLPGSALKTTCGLTVRKDQETEQWESCAANGEGSKRWCRCSRVTRWEFRCDNRTEPP